MVELRVGIPKPKTKGLGVVIPPGGVTEEVAADMRGQIKRRLASSRRHARMVALHQERAEVETAMAAAIAQSLESRGFAVDPQSS